MEKLNETLNRLSDLNVTDQSRVTYNLEAGRKNKAVAAFQDGKYVRVIFSGYTVKQIKAALGSFKTPVLNTNPHATGLLISNF